MSTPRSGNTWFRRLLCGALDLTEFAVHRQTDLNWAELPDRCIVQMHCRVKPDVLKISRDFSFQPVVIVRHPLDVLISILHFCTFEPQTKHWLDSEAGDEASIQGKDPTDPAFAAYATSPRAAALLSVSAEWMERQVPHVRYEDLVAKTEPELAGFLRQLAVEPVRPLSGVISAHTLEESRPTAENQHFWQGSPGLWTRLIGRDLADQIYCAHASAFARLGYGVHEARHVLPDESQSLWRSLGCSTTHQ